MIDWTTLMKFLGTSETLYMQCLEASELNNFDSDLYFSFNKSEIIILGE